MLAITTGEPAGIGPDICLDIVNTEYAKNCVLIGCESTLQQRAKTLGKDIQFAYWSPDTITPLTKNSLWLYPVETAVAVTAGQLTADNGHYVLSVLDTAIEGCQKGWFGGIVTAPVQKSIINDAGILFSGHTEYLAESLDDSDVVMMLANDNLRAALVTTHLPLRDIPDAITADKVTSTLRIVDKDLREKFGIAKPRISVCGLNPHAGEGGHLGTEEIEIIQPCIDKLKSEGLNLSDPLPADTAFTKKALDGVDAVVAMYHDQGLCVVKAQGFGEVVNISLGLPIVRTSVDHGTALDLAATGKASSTSLFSAIRCALSMQQGTFHLTR